MLALEDLEIMLRGWQGLLPSLYIVIIRQSLLVPPYLEKNVSVTLTLSHPSCSWRELPFLKEQPLPKCARTLTKRFRFSCTSWVATLRKEIELQRCVLEGQALQVSVYNHFMEITWL